MNVTRRLLVLASSLVLAGTLTACGSDTPTAETTPSPTPTTTAPATPSAMATGTPATCAAMDQARLALSDVRDVNILQEGTTAFKAKVDALGQDLDAAVEAARTEFAPQADAVRQAKDGLDTAVQQLGASPSVSSVRAIGTALSDLTTAFNQLTTAMDNAC